jgi:hypothetical protein
LSSSLNTSWRVLSGLGGSWIPGVVARLPSPESTVLISTVMISTVMISTVMISILWNLDSAL